MKDRDGIGKRGEGEGHTRYTEMTNRSDEKEKIECLWNSWSTPSSDGSRSIDVEEKGNRSRWWKVVMTIIGKKMVSVQKNRLTCAKTAV
jgi:hypothetical protein